MKHGSQTDPIFLHDLDKADRRRVIIFAIARLIAFSVVVLALYFFIPVGGFNDADPAAAWIRLAGDRAGLFRSPGNSIAADTHGAYSRGPGGRGCRRNPLMFLCLFALALHINVDHICVGL